MSRFNTRFFANRFWFTIVAMLFPFIATGCVSYESRKGVDNRWRDESVLEFKVGQTTQTEIINTLGPPSQVISLGDQLVFYYMLERQKGEGNIFIIYNRIDEKTTYDRAIFFFDNNGVLSEYAYSLEKVPYDKTP